MPLRADAACVAQVLFWVPRKVKEKITGACESGKRVLWSLRCRCHMVLRKHAGSASG